FRHKRSEVRLRDRLNVTDGQRSILITPSSRVGRDEFLPRHFVHRVKDTLVADPARLQLLRYHALALRCKIGGRRRFLSATSRSNRGKNQKLCNPPHSK